MSFEPAVRRTRNHLDWLRLLFASLVLLSHAPELVDGNRSRELLTRLTGTASFGEFAVSGFFALSGYLIMASWQRHPDLRAYFRNRVLRIYPGFMVAFCVSVLIVGPLAADGTAYFEQFTRTRFVFSLLTLREPWFAESFPALHYHSVNGALWTISYEFACYVAVALVAVLARRRLKAAWLTLTLLLLIAACFLPELEPFGQVNRFYVAALVRMSAIFFAGASLRLLGFDGARPRTMLLVGALFVATWYSHRFEMAGFALFGTTFFLSLGLLRSRVAAAWHFPDISYGTYLYGWPILELLIRALPGQGPWTIFVMALVLSLVCGYLSWTFVEAPFMRLKAGPARVAIATAPRPHAPRPEP